MKKNHVKPTVAETEQQPNTSAESTTLVILETAAEQAAAEQEQPEPPRQKTVAEITDKANRLNRTIDGLQKLNEAAKELDSLSLSRSPRLRDTLSIKDGSGTAFETSNPFLISTCIEYLQKKIEERTSELERELIEIEKL